MPHIAALIERPIRIRRHAPKLERRTERDAVMAKMSSFTVLPSRLVMDKFTAQDSINLLRVYHALAAHANKAGILRCSQERIAIALGLARKTVGRNIKILRERGLVGLVYRRPVGKNRFINVLRIIYDPNHPMTPQDAAAIAQPDTRTSTPQGQLRVPQVDTVHTSGTSHQPPVGHQGVPPLMGHVGIAHKQLEHITPLPPLRKSEVIATWTRTMQAHRHQAIATEADHATAQRCEQAGITRDQLEGAIADHLLDCSQTKRAPHQRLAPIVSDLLG